MLNTVPLSNLRPPVNAMEGGEDMAKVYEKTSLHKNTNKTQSRKTSGIECAARVDAYPFARHSALMKESEDCARRSLLKAIIRSYLE